MNPLVMPNAEPFFFPGGKTGILCVHGFFGTPDEIRRMGEDLAHRDYTVLGIRLFGHATRAQDVQRARWQDWLADVEDGLTILASACDQIFICGLSMGGILCLFAASRYPQIKGTIVMSTPMDLLPEWLLPPVIFLSKCLPLLHPMRYIKMFSRKVQQQINDLIAETIGYWDVSPNAFGEMLKMIRVTRSALAEISAPVLVVQSHNDPVVDFHNGPFIYNTLTCEGKKQLWLETSSHTIPDGPENQQVFAAAHEFIQNILKG